jgi:hypothetical protein
MSHLARLPGCDDVVRPAVERYLPVVLQCRMDRDPFQSHSFCRSSEPLYHPMTISITKGQQRGYRCKKATHVNHAVTRAGINVSTTCSFSRTEITPDQCPQHAVATIAHDRAIKWVVVMWWLRICLRAGRESSSGHDRKVEYFLPIIKVWDPIFNPTNFLPFRKRNHLTKVPKFQRLILPI